MILQVKEIANQNVKIAPQRKTMNSKIAPGKNLFISSLVLLCRYLVQAFITFLKPVL